MLGVVDVDVWVEDDYQNPYVRRESVVGTIECVEVTTDLGSIREGHYFELMFTKTGVLHVVMRDELDEIAGAGAVSLEAVSKMVPPDVCGFLDEDG
jgi:hypothetical protein